MDASWTRSGLNLSNREELVRSLCGSAARRGPRSAGAKDDDGPGGAPEEHVRGPEDVDRVPKATIKIALGR